jgi:hypothetical protein
MFDKCGPCPVRSIAPAMNCYSQTIDSPGLCIQYAQGVYHKNIIIRLSRKEVRPGMPAVPPFSPADVPGTTDPSL